jgi:poly(3-hydroxybutyrate) depolymerase
MLYELYELRHMLAAPVRFPAELTRAFFQNPLNPLSLTPAGRAIGASAEILSRLTQRFTRPLFNLNHTLIGGKKITVKENVIADRPFCRLLNFKRSTKRNDPKILLVAPLSGHYSTLLKGTVEALLPHHDIYITDWKDAREVPLSEGRFNLDDSMAYIHDFMGLLGPETHVIAVCQPSSLVLAAIAIMASERDPNQPASMILMGGPIDTRVSQTVVTKHAQSQTMRWFEDNVIHAVPSYYPGAGRHVYPGFLQLSGFMSMNMDLHVNSHIKFFQHAISGDGDSNEKHRVFYDEFLSVMDLPAEFYLQTITEVFQKQSLPRGKMKWRNPKTDELLDVRPQDIRHTALLTIEGELDDISSRGQTTAAHELCLSLPQRKQYHHFQLGCGHYGIFNGTRWRNEVMPRIRNFIRSIDEDKDPIPEFDLKKIPDIAAERFDRDKHGIAAVRRWIKENRPENFKPCRCVQKRTETRIEPDIGFYLTSEENIAPNKQKKLAPIEPNKVSNPKKKNPRINKGHKPKVKVHLPLLEPLEKIEKADPRANVIEVSFTKNRIAKPKVAAPQTKTAIKTKANTKASTNTKAVTKKKTSPSKKRKP